MGYYFIDYHTHTEMSNDNEQTLLHLCESAMNKDVKEICITEHIDFLESSFCYNKFSFSEQEKRIAEVSPLFPDLKIKIGVEIDYQREFFLQICDFIMLHDFDYIIGSCHRVDGVPAAFCDDYFIGKTDKEAYIRYFQTVKEAICTNMFTTIGHFDWIKRHGCRFYGLFDINIAKDIISECLEEMIKRDMTMEVSSAGLRQRPREMYPNIEILKLYKEIGGENVTFASDSHAPSQTSIFNKEIYDILKEIGFDKISIFNKKVKSFVLI